MKKILSIVLAIAVSVGVAVAVRYFKQSEMATNLHIYLAEADELYQELKAESSAFKPKRLDEFTTMTDMDIDGSLTVTSPVKTPILPT